MTNAEMMLAYARAQLGKLYKLGSHGPTKFDCSGLLMEMVKLMGLRWTHSSNSQWYNNIKANGDFSEYGDIDTLPPNQFAVIFHYGTRTNGQLGMVHVGVYDGVTHHSIQAGGYGKKVYVDGKKTSTVSEDPLDKRRWTKWAHIKGQDEEAGDYTATVSFGSKGASVSALQMALNAAGASLTIDGIFGPLTQAALIAYQSANGLTADGVCNDATWAALNAAEPDGVPEEDTDTADEPIDSATHSTVRRGSSGDDVTTLQTLLNAHGAGLVVDGKFGPLTEAAVRKYQGDNGLVIDGVVGQKTWQALSEAKYSAEQDVQG